MKIYNTYTLINEQTGNLALKVSPFEGNSQFEDIGRNNYYSLIWIKKGSGVAKIDFTEYNFTQDTMFTLTPYQPFLFVEKERFEGVVLNFHPDFFCIHKQ